MAGRKIFIILATICLTYAEVKLITEPKPGQEYVFLQTSGAGSRPIERKEKATESERVFETAHKLPPSLTYSLNKADDGAAKPLKPVKKVKREALPADGPAPAPAGAIKLDPLKLIEKYKTELKTSTTQAPKSTRRTTKTPKRSKKDIHGENVVATSPNPVLTTGASVAKVIDDDIPLVAAGSEKQRSRIQIKKGPNGQEYEYEYVYYYYDDEEDEKKDGKKVSNSHDGPARNEVTQKPSRGRGTTAAPEAAVNEVLPTSRGRGRGRQLAEEETVGEERLPANTRFPPRSRNLNTTPLPEEEEEVKPTRSRSRGKPSNDVAPESDSVSDETQGSRGRTRANVRRPSLELVDSASFNTHGSEPPNGSGGPSFPSDLPAGPVRFLGATPNEQPDEDAAAEEEEKPEAKPDSEVLTVTDENGEEVTTMMSPMDKVALDLYAILQGTQRLSGEEEVNTEGESTDASDVETTTLEVTTEELTTEEPTTTTTTTTTTTPAPTTTTTTTTAAPEPAFGRGRYRNRIGGKKSSQSTTTTEASQESKPKGKFERPRFGGARPRPGGRTTAAPTDDEPKITKEDSKPVSGGRTRTRFGGPRTRTTAAPSESSNDDSSSSSASAAPASKPSLRPRPSFNLRTRTRTTAAPSTEGGDEPAGEEEAAAPPSSTTARSRPRISAAGGSVRPLRPGPRINLSGRPRPGAAPSTEAPAETSAPAEDEETSKTEEAEEKEPEPSPAPDTNPLNRLRNRQRPQVQVKPKAAASAPVQVRRVNPLLARRKPGQAEPTSEAPAESPSTEATEEEEDEETDAPAPSSTSTTEEPRGLSKLLAGRRRLGSRQPGTLA